MERVIVPILVIATLCGIFFAFGYCFGKIKRDTEKPKEPEPKKKDIKMRIQTKIGRIDRHACTLSVNSSGELYTYFADGKLSGVFARGFWKHIEAAPIEEKPVEKPIKQDVPEVPVTISTD